MTEIRIFQADLFDRASGALNAHLADLPPGAAVEIWFQML
jgi:hypothetical protein